MKSKIHTFENGLRLVFIPMKGNPTVTSLIMVEAGTRYEIQNNNGISHFLEHMCFKGTEHRSSRDITSELDALGASSNAFTWYEYTGYYSKARKANFEKIFDIVADIYVSPTFPADELEKEKGVIIEEINMYKDLPMRHVHDLLYGLIYKGQPAGFRVLGPKKNIQKFKREDFLDYYKAHYQPKATTVVVAGDLNFRLVKRMVEETFGALRNSRKEGKKKVVVSQSRPQLLHELKKSDQTHFVLGFHGEKMGHKDDAAIDVMSAVLGEGMSSRLFRKLREEMGVCYYVRAGHEQYTDSGIMKISSGVDNKRFIEVLEAISAELRLLKNEKVGAKELKKAKEFLAGNTLMSLETSDDLATHYGELATLHQKLEVPSFMVNKLKRVTAEDVQRVANNIFKKSNLNLAIVGPKPKANPLAALKI